MAYKLFFIVCVVSLFSFTKAVAPVMDEECLNYTVYPLQYELNLYPYVNGDRFYIDCEVTITVIANTNNIRVIELDAKDIEINYIKVYDGRLNTISGARPFRYDNVYGKLYIYLNEPLRVYRDSDKQSYFIQITYRKFVKEDGDGIFLVKYYDEESKDNQFLITTRLSPNKAKYFFPCFDNPRFEAVFKFKVFIPQKSNYIQSNNTTLCIAKELRRSKENEYFLINYLPSPQVGLHQVGFHHSRFVSKVAYAMNSVDTFIVWAPIDEIDDFNYIFKYGITMINLIQEYSGTNRTLVQGPINLVAVPKAINGYEIGSWNLLTNGAHRIVKIDQYTSIKQIETMIFELAQQLSRIWLGNPGEIQRTRWKEEWFKEGMATYLAYYFVTQYNYGIQPIQQRPVGAYGLQMKHKAMALDWHRTTPALGVFNSSLAIEIPPRYKELVQTKTGAILWMLESWVESEKFHRSLVNFINSRRGKYISLQDFTTVLDRDNIECLNQFFNGSTASRILWSWLRRPGHPVINVQVLRDRIPNAIQLKQRQFSFTKENRHETDYLIPISYVVQNNQNCYNCYRPRFTIAQAYTFGENLNNGWILLNRQSSALSTAGLPAVREPNGLARSDGKRPDGMSLLPWKMGRPLVWDATCVDTLAPSHLPSTSGCAGAAAASAEGLTRRKYANLAGYYRVNYDTYTWRLIAKTLKENMESIDELNRAQIVNDVLILYVSGDIDVQLAMEILDYLDNEVSPVVWESVLDGFEKFTIEGAGCNMSKHLYWEWEEFLSKKVSKIFGQLVKSRQQDFLTRFFRSNVVELACSLNYEPCRTYVGRIYVEDRRGKHNSFPDCRTSYFYMLANETFSNTYSRKYNAIEQENKNIADHKIRERNRFFYQLPLGEPRPLPLIRSSTEKTIHTTELIKTDITKTNGSTSFSLSIMLLLISILINNFIS